MLIEDSHIVELKKVSKIYPPNISALKNITFSIKRGEFVFLTGPSGAGKTTLLKLLFRAEDPTAGEIWIDGIDVSSISRSQLPFLRRKIGVVFQDFKLLKDRTVLENVGLSLEIMGYGRRQINRRVRQILKAVGLKGKEDICVAQLSGGEQQRVSIARAVVNRPSILLADEPTGNLDKQRTKEVVELTLRRIKCNGNDYYFSYS